MFILAVRTQFLRTAKTQHLIYCKLSIFCSMMVLQNAVAHILWQLEVNTPLTREYCQLGHWSSEHE
jgi:hypothetical protein